MNGFFNMLKPPGMTSHDMVDAVRKLIPGIKVGHGGTLDPGAAGVLPILLGKATRLSQYILEFPKTYRAELCLGVSTDTADSFGNITGRGQPPLLGKDELQNYLDSFIGEIEQLPPMFSAVKRKGKKLYEYARQGREVERRPRRVKIFALRLIAYCPPEKILFEVKCSSGTYVRTLCEQLGNMIGCGGHMSFLVRLVVGPFHLDKTCALEELTEGVQASVAEKVLLPADFPFMRVKKALLEQEILERLFKEKSFTPVTLGQKERVDLAGPVDGQLMPVYTTEGEFAALVRCKVTENDMVSLQLEKKWM